MLHIRAFDLPKPEREYRIVPDRRFRWDFVWPKHKLAAEIQGGVFVKGAHSTGTGITRDCTKANLAALAGFRCFFFTTGMVRDGSAIDALKRALGGV
jgi:hypothetical protein